MPERVPAPDRGAFALAALLVATAVWAALRAYEKPLWHDELYTVLLGRLPTVADIWRAVTEGTDTNPPPGILLGRLARLLIADDHLAYRLPSILGLLAIVLSVHLVVARRADRLSALAAATFVLCTPLATYAFEARPYAPMVGCVALAIVAWQRIDEHWLFAAAFALALAAALSLHYYAVLVWPAFALAEAARWLDRRRLRIGAGLALAAGALPLLLFAGHLAALKRYFGPTYWLRPVGLDDFLLMQNWLLFGGRQDATNGGGNYWGLFLTVVAIAGLVLWRLRRASPDGPQDGPLDGPPLEDQVLAAGLLILPLTAFVMSQITGVGMAARYMLPTALGGAMAVGYLANRAPQAARKLLLAAMLANFALSALPILTSAARGTLLQLRQANTQLLRDALAGVADEGLPIAMARGLIFLPFTYYSPGDQAARLHTFARPPTAIEADDTSYSAELGFLLLRKYTPLQVEDYTGFVARHRAFILLQTDFDDWWPQKLVKDGHRLTLLAANAIALVYRVEVRSEARP